MLTSIPQDLPRKERERWLRRRDILLAAQQVFAEKGYEYATVEEIAERAEFSKGALYNYFLNKEDIFNALLQEGFENFEALIEQALSGGKTLRDQFQLLARGVLEYFEANPDFLTILMKENLQMKIKLLGPLREKFAGHRQLLVDRIAGRLREATAAGVIRHFDPIQLVEVFWNIIFAFLLHSRCQDEKANLADDAEAIVSIFFDGIVSR